MRAAKTGPPHALPTTLTHTFHFSWLGSNCSYNETGIVPVDVGSIFTSRIIHLIHPVWRFLIAGIRREFLFWAGMAGREIPKCFFLIDIEFVRRMGGGAGVQ